MKNVKPEALDAQRRKKLAAPEAALAPKRPAFGLTLDQSTLKDGQAWAKERALTCTDRKRGYTYLQCSKVAPRAIGESYSAAPIDLLVLTFGSKGTLIGVQTYRRGVTGQVAEEILKRGGEQLAQELGPPTQVSGDSNAAAFQGQGFASAQVNYHFRDYLATLTASTLPGSGVVVMEKFYSTTL